MKKIYEKNEFFYENFKKVFVFNVFCFKNKSKKP